MTKTSPTTYKIGTIGTFAAWTKQVVRGEPDARGMPRKWFDSEKTAQQISRPNSQSSSIRETRLVSGIST